MRTGLASRIRDAAASRADDFGAEDMAKALGLASYAERAQVRVALRDFLKRGEIVCVAHGRYRYSGGSRDVQQKPPQKRVIMWRYLRMRRTVTVMDLMDAARSAEPYVKEWLRALVRMEIVEDCGNGNYLLIADSVEPPPAGKSEPWKMKRRERNLKRRQELAEALTATRVALAATLDVLGAVERLANELCDEDGGGA